MKTHIVIIAGDSAISMHYVVNGFEVVLSEGYLKMAMQACPASRTTSTDG